MKENSMILKRVFRRHIAEFVVLFLLAIFVAVNFPFSKGVFAARQLACVSACFSKLEGENENIIAQNQLIFGDTEQNLLNFDDISANLLANGKLKCKFEIASLHNQSLFATLAFGGQAKNVEILCEVDGLDVNFEQGFAQFEVEQANVATVVVWVKIKNVANDALLRGNLQLLVGEV